MDPYCGYQLYQAQRIKTRAEILAADAWLGRQAAAVIRGAHALAGQTSTPGIMPRRPHLPHLLQLRAGTDMVNSTYQWLDLTARGRH